MLQQSQFSLEDCYAHWLKAALQDRDEQNLRPTARDPYLQEVVETAMEKWLYPCSSLLDIGCGDGLSTLRFAKGVRQAVGVDFVPRYVEKAKAHQAQAGVANADFLKGNVLDLSPIRQRFGTFDRVTTIRCLINLNSWDNQARGLREIAACVKPGGYYLTSEGWRGGLARSEPPPGQGDFSAHPGRRIQLDDFPGRLRSRSAPIF